MNWVGGGFVSIVNYSGSSTAFVSSNKALLTEASDEILTEASDYLEYEP